MTHNICLRQKSTELKSVQEANQGSVVALGHEHLIISPCFKHRSGPGPHNLLNHSQHLDHYTTTTTVQDASPGDQDPEWMRSLMKQSRTRTRYRLRFAPWAASVIQMDAEEGLCWMLTLGRTWHSYSICTCPYCPAFWKPNEGWWWWHYLLSGHDICMGSREETFEEFWCDSWQASRSTLWWCVTS